MLGGSHSHTLKFLLLSAVSLQGILRDGIYITQEHKREREREGERARERERGRGRGRGTGRGRGRVYVCWSRGHLLSKQTLQR
jgi:UPF0288 family protein (methanogenesis marker protein 3)